MAGRPTRAAVDGQLGARLPASGAGHLSAAQVGSITPQGLAQLPAPLRHVIALAFAHALPPLYAYLIQLLAVAFLLALILKEIPLRTRARRDAAQAARAQPGARPRAPWPPASARPGRRRAPPQVEVTPTALHRPRLPHRWNNPPAT